MPFKKGQSGNPRGREAGIPNKATADVKALAGAYGPAAIQKAAELAGLVEGKSAASSEAAQMGALNTILDRAYGKPSQPIAGDPDAPLELVTRTDLERAKAVAALVAAAQK